jgi:hypothetical protein
MRLGAACRPAPAIGENASPRDYLLAARADAALAFYGEIFRFTLRGRGERNAFIGLGDQFIALMQGSGAGKLEQQHFAARAGGEGHGGLTPAPAVLHPCRAQSADLRGGYAVPRLRRFPSYAGFSVGSSSAGSRPNS